MYYFVFRFIVLILIESDQYWYSYWKIPNRSNSIFKRGKT